MSLGCPSAWERGTLGLISWVDRDTKAQRGRAAQGRGQAGHQVGGRGSCSPQSDQSLLGKTPSHRDPGIWACRKGASGQAQGPPVGSPHSPFSVCPAELCLVPQQAHGWAAASTLDVTGGQDGQKGPPAPSRLLPRSRRTREHPGRGTSPASAAASGASVHTCGSGSRFSQHRLSSASRPSFHAATLFRGRRWSPCTLGSVAGTCPPREQRRDGGGGGRGQALGRGTFLDKSRHGGSAEFWTRLQHKPGLAGTGRPSWG